MTYNATKAKIVPKISASQRAAIYGMGSQLGIHEKGNRYDDLHALVFTITHKNSIGELDMVEANKVISELDRISGYSLMDKSPVQKDEAMRRYYHKEQARIKRDGMIASAKIKKVWVLMYKLRDLDADKVTATAELAKRLCAVIEKHLGVDANINDPFRFVTDEKGSVLIEVLKKIVAYEERKAKNIEG